MSEIKIKVGGSEFQAKLSIEAIEAVEAQFGNDGIMILLGVKQSVRAMRAVVVQSIAAANPDAGVIKAALAATGREIEEGGGIEALGELAIALVNASGIRGKDKARITIEASSGNG